MITIKSHIRNLVWKTNKKKMWKDSKYFWGIDQKQSGIQAIKYFRQLFCQFYQIVYNIKYCTYLCFMFEFNIHFEFIAPLSLPFSSSFTLVVGFPRPSSSPRHQHVRPYYLNVPKLRLNKYTHILLISLSKSNSKNKYDRIKNKITLPCGDYWSVHK